MSRRTLWPDAMSNIPKAEYFEFSFLTNGASDPLVTSFIPSTASGIKTITHSATGEYTVTLADDVRPHACVTRYCDIEELSTGDGRYASMNAVANTGASSSNVTFKVWTNAANGTKTDFTGFRVSITLCFKAGLVNG